MRSIRPQAIALDLDGTLYHAGTPIPGAAEALSRLRAAGLPLRFVTNTFATSPEGILARLSGYGIEIDPTELFTPRRALRSMLAEKAGLRMHAFLSPELRAALDFLPPQEEEAPELLLLGDAEGLWSHAAFDRLLGYLFGGAELFATSRAQSYVGKDGKAHLDTGALVALFEAASGAKARILGKPSAEFGALVAEGAGVAPERLLVVGDDPSVDMALAKALGGPSVLVETGKGAGAVREPAADAVIPSIAELPALLGL